MIHTEAFCMNLHLISKAFIFISKVIFFILNVF